MISIHPNMGISYPNTFFGVLIFENFHVRMEEKEIFKQVVEKELRDICANHTNYNRKDFCETNGVVRPYVQYYKKFKKTYHVLAQLESVLNGKSFPEAIPLVQVLFLTELKTSLLIAGHDLKKCSSPLTIQEAQGGETYLGSGNSNIVVKPKDICLKDTKNYILSIIYGQDERTRLTKETDNVMFLIDGVPGLERKYVEDGLAVLLDYIRILDPEIVPQEMRIIASSKQNKENTL